MKRISFILVVVYFISAVAKAQTSYTDVTATGTWNTSRWNNSSDGPTYTSTYTANNAVSFTSGTYSIAGMGAVINVGNITVASGVTVNFTAAANTFATNGTVRTIDVGSGGTFNLSSQAISTTAGTGFNKTGSGTLIITSGGSYAGGFTLTAGTMVAGGVNAMGSGGALTLNGGVLTVNSSTARDFSNKYTGGITIGGNVQLGDSVNVSAGTGNMTFNNNVALGTSVRTLTIGGNGTYTFSGVVSGSGGGLSVSSGTGSGTIVLSGANTFTGGVTLGSGAKLNLNNAAALGTGTFTISGGTINNSSLADITSSTNNNAQNWNGDFTFTGTNSLNLGTGAVTLGASRQVTVSGSTLTVGGAIGDGSSGYALTKAGSGTLALSGNNTFSGGVTVSAGTLTASHNNALGSGATSISSGATLSVSSSITIPNNVTVTGTLTGASGATFTGTIKGSGTLSGSLTIGSGGSIAPGNSPGTLTVASGGSLTFNTGSTYSWELGSLTTSGAGTNFDLIALSGTATLTTNGVYLVPSFLTANSAPNATTPDAFWSSSQSWTVVSGNGTGPSTITGTFLVDNSAYTNGSFTTLLSGNDLIMTWTPSAIPEPSTYAAIFGAGALGFAVWRRRQQKQKTATSSTAPAV